MILKMGNSQSVIVEELTGAFREGIQTGIQNSSQNSSNDRTNRIVNEIFSSFSGTSPRVSDDKKLYLEVSDRLITLKRPDLSAMLIEPKLKEYDIYSLTDYIRNFPSDLGEKIFKKFIEINPGPSKDLICQNIDLEAVMNHRIIFDYCDFDYNMFTSLLKSLPRELIASGKTLNIFKWVDPEILGTYESISRTNRFSFISPSSYAEAMEIEGFTPEMLVDSLPNVSVDGMTKLFELGAELNDQFLMSYYPEDGDYESICQIMSHPSLLKCSKKAIKIFATRVKVKSGVEGKPFKYNISQLLNHYENLKLVSFDCYVCQEGYDSSLTVRCSDKAEEVSHICIKCANKIDRCPLCRKTDKLICFFHTTEKEL